MSGSAERRDPPTPQQLRRGGNARDEVFALQRKRLFAATIEAAARHGPRNITAEELRSLARVSKRVLYDQFAEGKGTGVQRCIAAVCAAVLSEAARRVRAASLAEAPWRELMELGVRAATVAIAGDPDAARHVLLDAYDAKLAPVSELLAGWGELEAAIADGLAEANGPDPPPLVAKGIVAGIAHVARVRLIAGEESSLPALSSELAGWAAACCEGVSGPAAVKVAPNAIPASARPRRAGGSGAAAAKRTLPPSRRVAAPRRSPARAAVDARKRSRQQTSVKERDWLIDTCARVASESGYGALKVAPIETGALLSRGAFHRHFADLPQCFLAAYEHACETIFAASLETVRLRGEPVTSGVEEAHAYALAFTQTLARRPLDARLCLCEALVAGADGVYAQTGALERFASQLRKRLEAGGQTGGQEPPAVALSAAVGAMWTVAGHLVANGRIEGLPSNVRSFARLLRGALPPRRRA